MSKNESDAAATAAADDEPDEWRWAEVRQTAGKPKTPDGYEKKKEITGPKNIANKTVENLALTDCYYEKKDWRACKDEMEKFRACWKANNNDKRTSTQDVEKE
ncbi:chch domain-containing protein [Ophiostoma piceae UAMH 11346]|uniref:Chch domain-containing protein n=1 Tax=Ophiostoma piceae (strain UAMH 11346) TaxID=1262450 RepID=S3C122_OPHP1|nr:chch domain-containing protein [Ophiostoma piceae UAMH 11346]